MSNLIKFKPRNASEVNKETIEMVAVPRIKGTRLLWTFIWSVMLVLIWTWLGVFSKPMDLHLMFASSYWLSLYIIALSMLGEVEVGPVIIVALLPGINYILAIFGLWCLGVRIKQGCPLGHDWEEIRRPNHHPYARMGGFDEYRCKCGARQSIKWDAF